MPINPQTLKCLQENDPDIIGLNLTLEVESDEDVLKLVKALKDNTYLRSLTIQGMWNKPGIGDRSAVLLRSCCHLVYLDLSFNKRITNIGAEALALAKNSAIEDLFLRGCSVTPEGLVPFLKNDTVLDLRIAISSAPSEQVSEAIKLKLEENRECKVLRRKLQGLSVDNLNDEFYQFVRENPVHIQELMSPLPEMAEKDFRHEENAITVGLILSNHLSKLTGMVAKKAAMYAQRYRVLREAQHEFAELQSEQKFERKRSRSPSFSPLRSLSQSI